MELSKSKVDISVLNKVNAIEKLENSIHFLKTYKNKKLLPNEVCNKINNSLNIALEISKYFRNKIIITGLINSGKSTFINKLLGKFILHTSCIENSKWPIIIRHSEDETPRLYSTKLSSQWVYEFEEVSLLAEGIDEVDKKLKFINSSNGLNDKYKQFLVFLSSLKSEKGNDNSKSNNLSHIKINQNSFDKKLLDKDKNLNKQESSCEGKSVLSYDCNSPIPESNLNQKKRKLIVV